MTRRQSAVTLLQSLVQDEETCRGKPLVEADMNNCDRPAGLFTVADIAAVKVLLELIGEPV